MRNQWSASASGRRGGLVIAGMFGIVLHAQYAVADEPWKDGCPGKYAPEYLPKDFPDLPTHNGSAAFGALPDIDDSLGPSRVALATSQGFLRQLSGEDGLPPNLLGMHLIVQKNFGSSGPMVMVSQAWGYVFSLDDSSKNYHHRSNFQAYVGYRHTSYLLRPAFRTGWAVRLGGGSAFGGNDVTLVQERQRMAAIAPFRTQLYGFDRPLSATAEYRIEMIGCHGPFLHARIDMATWDTRTGMETHRRVFVTPVTIAAGGFIFPRFAIYSSFGVEFRSPESEMLYRNVKRTSVGAEFQSATHHSRLGFRASAFTGDQARGLELVMTLSNDFWGGPR